MCVKLLMYIVTRMVSAYCNLAWEHLTFNVDFSNVSIGLILQ